LPLLTRVAGLPLLERGQRVELDVLAIDEVDLSVELRLHRVLQETAGRIEEVEDDEMAVAAEEPPAVVPSPDLPQGG